MNYSIDIKKLINNKIVSNNFNSLYESIKLKEKEKKGFETISVNCTLPNARNGGIEVENIFIENGGITVSGNEIGVSEGGRKLIARFNSFGNLEYLKIGKAKGKEVKIKGRSSSYDFYSDLVLKSIVIRADSLTMKEINYKFGDTLSLL